MLKYFQNRKEKQTLREAFKLASGLAVYIAMECMEKNYPFFAENPALLEKGKSYIDSGMEYAEKGNYRAAYNFYFSFIEEIIEKHPELISEDTDLYEALERIINMNNTTITPLFAKHYE